MGGVPYLDKFTVGRMSRVLQIHYSVVIRFFPFISSLLESLVPSPLPTPRCVGLESIS